MIKKLAIVISCALLLTGCLTPKTYQLERIHASYATEWATAEVPEPGKMARPEGSAHRAFQETLSLIANYKLEYGDESRIAAHLTVLEGMIYLQTGEIGMARLLQPKVAAAAGQLESGTGRATRDQIFATSFKELTEGWDHVLRETGNAAALERLGEDLIEKLDGMQERAQTDADGGGAYVATSAAIFLLWAHSIDSESYPLKTVAKKGAEALEPWLDPTTLAANEGTNRFVDWYRWLRRAAE